jgi:SagB-type dehydrogenase family enzyme
MKDFSAEFLERTSYPKLSPPPQQSGVNQPPLELPWPDDAALIPLTAPADLDIPGTDLRQVVEQRRSLRRYTTQPLSLPELSYLLWLTQGVKRITGRPATLRPVPSAGARHAFETLLLVNRVQDIEPGLYRYIATRHALLSLDAPVDIATQMSQACLGQEHVLHSAVTFCWLAVTERMAWRYVERSMRYLFLDAGHVCQNLYLAAEAIGCGVCAIAAFEDVALNRVIGADGVEQFAIYLGTVGKRPTT